VDWPRWQRWGPMLHLRSDAPYRSFRLGFVAKFFGGGDSGVRGSIEPAWSHSIYQLREDYAHLVQSPAKYQTSGRVADDPSGVRYSLGVLLYELVAGRRPYRLADTPLD
jgi:hypothetical protein